ncbi:MAG: hypothetical protein A2583_00915 [Bdellovibrionales bacterium RIFOXYD1_FULL_53_11]|nr:MAG: hypothetical protein A2583_00915 [Bdellovibrionales bacterium RIFOXYD1_FULL_53_11]
MKTFRPGAGFTLLETVIALAIMTVAFSAILMVESASLSTAEKARRMNTVSMLAKNLMAETELKMEGKKFNELKEEEAGEFKAPFEEYTWKRKIKEIKFPNLGVGGSGKSGEGDDAGGMNAAAEKLAKLMATNLSKAVREVTVSVVWKKGGGEQSFSVSTYWVNLNHEFQLTE